MTTNSVDKPASKDARATIKLSKELHQWLKSKGKKDESYEEIIRRLTRYG